MVRYELNTLYLLECLQNLNNNLLPNVFLTIDNKILVKTFYMFNEWRIGDSLINGSTIANHRIRLNYLCIRASYFVLYDNILTQYAILTFLIFPILLNFQICSYIVIHLEIMQIILILFPFFQLHDNVCVV